jgi:hypothetical protein
MQGPAASQPQLSQQTAPQHDRFERRREEHRTGLVADVAMEVASHRDTRAWGRLVLAGDAKLRAALKSGLPSSSRGEALETDQKLENLSFAQLESALVPELDKARAAQRAETATRVDGLARSGSAATTGVRATVAALAEG